MATPKRTSEQIVREIEEEREQLAAAVSELQREVKAKLPALVAAAVVVAGALTALQVTRRKRHGVVRARFGRYTVIERD
jgi:hypothetical protein